jgi:hypothetical protein
MRELGHLPSFPLLFVLNNLIIGPLVYCENLRQIFGQFLSPDLDLQICARRSPDWRWRPGGGRTGRSDTGLPNAPGLGELA